MLILRTSDGVLLHGQETLHAYVDCGFRKGSPPELSGWRRVLRPATGKIK